MSWLTARWPVTIAGAAAVSLALAGCSSAPSRPTASHSSTAARSAASKPVGPTVAPSPSSSAAPAAPSSAAAAAPAVPPVPAVPAPAATGNVSQLVPNQPVSSLPPVPLTGSATAAGMSVSLRSAEAVQGDAKGPGEVGGPAVRITVAVNNATGSSMDLTSVVVDLTDSAGASAGQLSGPGAAPFTGSVAPGQTATGVYVFSLAQDDRHGDTISVSLTASAPVVVFTGDLP